jgi:hypothetical protein
MASKTNGATADYLITVTPASRVFAGDVFKIKFPEDIVLPENANLRCSPEDGQLHILEISCLRRADQLVEFTFVAVDSAVVGDGPPRSFALTVHDARNPLSLRPTDPFSEIVMLASGVHPMSRYDQGFSISTDTLGQLPNDPAITRLTHSNPRPGEPNEITIHLRTNNPLREHDVIEVTVPAVIPRVMPTAPSNPTCSIFLNGALQDPVDQLGRPKCTVDPVAKLVTYQRIFAVYHDAGGYRGEIQLEFRITNPAENNNDLRDEPYGLTIYDGLDQAYGVDELDSTLYPSLNCRFPCNTCLETDPAHCLSCLPNSGLAYLHRRIGETVPTCVAGCTEDPGFTNNGTRDPKRCVPCDHTCAECAQNEAEGDVDLCTACDANRFPFHWASEFTCHLECPDGSYTANEDQCVTCSAECWFCSGPQTCTRCRADSNAPGCTEAGTCNLNYLFNGQCMDSCLPGYTSIYAETSGNVCERCNSPCGSCYHGAPDKCITCDNTADEDGNGRSFLFRQSCVADCPIKTVAFVPV